VTDHPGGPDEKWSRWSINQAKESVCVLIVGSPGWYAAYAGTEVVPSADGRGAAAEANVIQEQLYQSKWIATRHRIVLLDDSDAEGLPVEISGWRVFRPNASEQDCNDLIRWAVGRTSPKQPRVATDSWPVEPATLDWPMADHSGAREAFAKLLTSKAPWRYLPIRGSSETGKSHITRQMLANALVLPGIACGRFDFKGTTDMDREVRSFIQELGVPMPSASPTLDARLGSTLSALRERAHPTLLILDTYEMAGEAQDWVQRQLLPCLIRASGVLEAQGKLAEAGAAFGENLSISRRLAKQDPTNARWQRELAVACCVLARVHRKCGRHDAALALCEEAEGIMSSLVEMFPDFAGWRSDRDVIAKELALCRRHRG